LEAERIPLIGTIQGEMRNVIVIGEFNRLELHADVKQQIIRD
jgi:hypothetical protein